MPSQVVLQKLGKKLTVYYATPVMFSGSYPIIKQAKTVDPKIIQRSAVIIAV